MVSTVLLLAFDQITKYMAVLHLKDQPAIPIIKNVFELQYLENRGAAFGSFQGRQIGLLIITILIVFGIVYIYQRVPDTKKYLPLHVTLILLFSGAIGNMIDRVLKRYVVDFLYFKYINFPIFNVADCYVTIAAFLLIVLVMFVYKEEEFEFLSLRRKEK